MLHSKINRSRRKSCSKTEKQKKKTHIQSKSNSSVLSESNIVLTLCRIDSVAEFNVEIYCWQMLKHVKKNTNRNLLRAHAAAYREKTTVIILNNILRRVSNHRTRRERRKRIFNRTGAVNEVKF